MNKVINENHGRVKVVIYAALAIQSVYFLDKWEARGIQMDTCKQLYLNKIQALHTALDFFDQFDFLGCVDCCQFYSEMSFLFLDWEYLLFYCLRTQVHT